MTATALRFFCLFGALLNAGIAAQSAQEGYFVWAALNATCVVVCLGLFFILLLSGGRR